MRSSVATSNTGEVITSKVGEEAIQRLKSVFPDNLILAALDLVDRDSGEWRFFMDPAVRPVLRDCTATYAYEPSILQ